MADVALVFDLDGTLIESAGAIMAVGNRLLAERGAAPLDLAETKRFIGAGAQRFIDRAFDARGLPRSEAAYERFETFYAEADPLENAPFAGADAALRALAADGWPLGLCTNKPFAPTMRVLDALDWTPLFGAVVAGETLAVKKPDPAPLLETGRRLGVDRVVFIGDSEVDAETARRAPAPFVLFTEGYRQAPIETLAPAAAFSRFDALAALVASLASPP